MTFNKNRVLTGLFLIILSACTTTNKEQTSLHTLKFSSEKDLYNYFHFSIDHDPIISAHRGGARVGYPENCIPTFENVLLSTPAFFEVDPRLTKDSVIILMHDVSLDRTTNGTGKVSDYTWEQLKKLKLKDDQGNITPYRIPTLREAVAWSKGKTVLNLDKKDVPLQMLARKLEEYQADANIMVTVHNAEQASFYYQKNEKRMFSAFVKSIDALKEYEKAQIPWSRMIAYIGSEIKPENKKLYEMLHARGVMCMISAAPVYDKLEDPTIRERKYKEIIEQGADILESDRPIEVALALNSGLSNSTGK